MLSGVTEPASAWRAAGFKVHFTPTQEGMALEDFNGKEIWDAAWGEADYTYDDEEDGDDEESAPWGLTNKRIEGFPELPGEEELKEREEVRICCHMSAAIPSYFEIGLAFLSC